MGTGGWLSCQIAWDGEVHQVVFEGLAASGEDGRNWVCRDASRCLVSPRVDGNMNDTLMVRTCGLDLPVR